MATAHCAARQRYCLVVGVEHAFAPVHHLQHATSWSSSPTSGSDSMQRVRRPWLLSTSRLKRGSA
jgi:hypothetical protein